MAQQRGIEMFYGTYENGEDMELRCMDAEDAGNIDDIYCSRDVSDRSDSAIQSAQSCKPDPNGPCLLRALDASRKLGKAPVKVPRDPRKRDLLSIKGREETFDYLTWRGPAIKDVTRAGFFCVNDAENKPSADTAACAYCKIHVRFETKNDDPLKLHRQLSPQCRHLKTDGAQFLTYDFLWEIACEKLRSVLKELCLFWPCC